jgi:acyl-CoA thioesterase
MTRDPAETARKSAEALWAQDKASQAMGMRLDKIAPGLAVLSMNVGVSMVNGYGTCHGGYIFSLADSALAFASCSHSQPHVAQHCQISYVAPGRLGMRLVAEARERHRAERTGIYDVTVRTDAGEVIAEFRGQTRLVPGTLVPEV